jgi:hypothetical protein
MLTRPSYHTLRQSYASQIFSCTRSYAINPSIPYPSMTAISDPEILSRFAKLSISHPEVIQHGPVKTGAEWKAELKKTGKADVALTKTVSSISAVLDRRCRQRIPARAQQLISEL